MNDKGIVTLAGGDIYFLNAYLNFRILRTIGCKLPMEWFYLGNEMKPEWIKKIKDTISEIELIDLGNINKDNTKGNGGWQKKVESIIESSFNEILFLDADCFPIKDPSYLFNHEFFKTTGCVLFPDIHVWREKEISFLNSKFNVSLPKRAVESGQMIFNKEKCIDGLIKARELNRNSEDTYKVLYGDKDTFLIGMLQANCDFKVSPHLCDCFPPLNLYHRDFDGNLLFMHLTGAKFRHHGRPFIKRKYYPHIDLAIEIMKELKFEKLI